MSARNRLRLSAFVMATTSHILEGQWRHPQAQQHRFDELSLWTDLARQLEAARFDAIFFADVVGLYGNYRGSWDIFATEGLQIPSHDPSVMISALGAVTEHLGLAWTSSVIQEHPFTFARRAATLDHLTGGRTGWNIVTSALENAHRNFGLPGLTPHDERYRWADEYVEVVYKLLEGSWEDDALRRDKAAGVHADPAKIHKIHHRGERYSVEGPHLVAPSAQRTPVLFQAGTSPAGMAFAARNAEAVFMFAGSPDSARKITTTVRAGAAGHGRRPEDVLFFAGLSFVVGSTEAEARRRKADFDEYLSVDGLAAHMLGGMGVDLGDAPVDTPLKDLRVEGGRGVLQAVIDSVPGGNPTIEDMVRYRAERMRLVGTPERIADELERWQDAGIDGINIINHVIPGSYAEVIDGLLPELRSRGLAQAEYAPGTFREKLYSDGARLNPRHPAASYRAAFHDAPR
ncbi:FMN-dependent oxidoreductase, nitrilotriacetate monooxygenase family [Saccharopolyspora kobensis]|uniref:FMN-dependent oxidoreductase, nitrilotriacetate monooxygenase family n=1 Tax=Saccharopolyspora kobensis TaxID=146035 RepID=A0A1H5X686_9PSEU|nr:LLM class flavin-dependent oxidoreductase [Saccharopolyspora kobensis]SEG06900.1 FMN-dependent oxidoreductase, nitrilotriacetate monooxygenase family [Saccharopolyspora kobensis]SFE47293.1 FMN-dependent oxidoreductase, nitrilotriacetate monooxygenase family [Saccharopolyspora kobensis]